PAIVATYQHRLDTVEARDELPAQAESDAVRDVLGVLRSRTGHDFSSYKIPTLLRRIRRRALVRQLDSLPQYAALVRSVPDEAPSLMKELLISVTRFFRDPEAFATLAQIVMPRVFRDKG